MNDSPAEAAHRAEACKRMSPVGQKLFKYVEFDEDEELIAEIRKHPIGYIGIGATGIFITLAVFIGTLLIGLNLDNMGLDLGDNSASIKTAIILVGLILSVLVLAATAISIVLYIRNVIFVTNEKIAEVTYHSLFNREVTQLGMGQVEDVTVEQKGILSRIFGYGTLLVETAGEKENAMFTLVPKPHTFSQPIVKAHENYVEKYGN